MFNHRSNYRACNALSHDGKCVAAREYLRERDLFVIHSMDRLARNLDDLRRIVLGLTQKGVHVQFIKENLTFHR
jgi:DNA invertase Pin-like site-specific DNA recombinase